MWWDNVISDIEQELHEQGRICAIKYTSINTSKNIRRATSCDLCVKIWTFRCDTIQIKFKGLIYFWELIIIFSLVFLSYNFLLWFHKPWYNLVSVLNFCINIFSELQPLEEYLRMMFRLTINIINWLSLSNNHAY